MAQQNNMAALAQRGIQKAAEAANANDTAITRTELESVLNEMLPRLRESLPAYVTPERIMRVAINAFGARPELRECTKLSLLGGIVKASQMGLEIDLMDEATLVAFWSNKRKVKEAQLMIGYQGLMKLGLNSGLIGKWSAHVVYEKDTFSYSYGTDEHLKHVPYHGSDRGPIVAAYSIVRFKNGFYDFVVVGREDLDRVRAVSRDSEGNFWTQWEDRMSMKTAIRAHYKTLPKSREMRTAAILDGMHEGGMAQGIDLSKVDAVGDVAFEAPQQAEQAPVVDAEVIEVPSVEPEEQERKYKVLLDDINKVTQRIELVGVSRRMRAAREENSLTVEQFNNLAAAIDAKDIALQQESPGEQPQKTRKNGKAGR
jgi:recombination protein RecT